MMKSLEQQEVIRIGSGLKGSYFVLGAIILVLSLSFPFFKKGFLGLSQSIQEIKFFKVSEIEVTTEWPLEVGRVRQWMTPLQGKNIFWIDSREVARTLQNQPWVQEVAIKKSFPHSLMITLTAKKPFALVMKQGQPWFIDPEGNLIEKVTSGLLKGIELPFLSFDKESSAQWDVAKVLKEYEKMKTLAQHKITVSQIVLGNYPYFKTYLSHPQWEVWWSFENWEDQLKNLLARVVNPRSQIGQLKRINLVFPKKAIVSSRISH